MTKKVKEMCEKALKLYYNELVTVQLLYHNYSRYEGMLNDRMHKYIDFYNTLFNLGVIIEPDRQYYVNEVITAVKRITNK